MNTSTKAKRIRPLLVFAVLLLIIIGLWTIVQYVVLPKIAQLWQTNLIIFAAGLLSVLGGLAAITQISGYSLRDWAEKKVDKTANFSDEVQSLVRPIREHFYGDNAELTAVLSKALELCDRLGYTEYATWIRKELAGFGGYERQDFAFKDTDTFDNWGAKWMSHRMVKTYLKIQSVSERGDYQIEELEYERVLVGSPVQTIIDIVEGAKAHHQDELFIEFARLERNCLEDVRNRLSRIAPEMAISSNSRLFIRRFEYERILFGIRNKVAELMSLISLA